MATGATTTCFSSLQGHLFYHLHHLCVDQIIHQGCHHIHLGLFNQLRDLMYHLWCHLLQIMLAICIYLLKLQVLTDEVGEMLHHQVTYSPLKQLQRLDKEKEKQKLYTILLKSRLTIVFMNFLIMQNQSLKMDQQTIYGQKQMIFLKLVTQLIKKKRMLFQSKQMKITLTISTILFLRVLSTRASISSMEVKMNILSVLLNFYQQRK